MTENICTKDPRALEQATQRGDAVSTLGGFLDKNLKSLEHFGLTAQKVVPETF